MFKKLPLGRFETNCYVIADEETKEAAVIDPSDDFNTIKQFIIDNNLKVKYILLTHAHGDHILALPELKKYSNAAIGVHSADEDMLNSAALNMSGQFTLHPIEVKPDFHLVDGEILSLGNKKAKVIHTPGHTKGSVCILFENDLVSGDTLFARGIGRTDFYGGDYDALISSVETKLFVLPENINVHPGHGASSTILAEKEGNPFFK